MRLNENIETDSRLVKKGDIFIAINGAERDAHEFIKDVLDRGASKVLCERVPAGLSPGEKKRIKVVPDTREELARLTKEYFGDPAAELKVYGVTGTNGKTTTVFLIDKILNTANLPSGFVSTVFVKTSGNVLTPASMTTPDVVSLYRHMREMADSGKKAAVIEISSHALSQKRVHGISFDGAVFTNLTPEHLDYHKDMEGYLADKAKIFSHLKPGRVAAINTDDPRVFGLKNCIKQFNVVSYGIDNRNDAIVRAEDIKLSADATSFRLVAGKIGEVDIHAKLIGKHNVYNMLSAVSALYSSGIGTGKIKEALEGAQAVPGRLESLKITAPFRVYVDYAHTPNALENVLNYVRPVTKGKLICVFGCGGDRDRTKRPAMGKIAAEICDKVILTSDNPRSENPMDILNEIEKGVPSKSDYRIIENRREAIYAALETARAGDVVIIAGKGHEDYQIVGKTKTHFDDKEVALGILKEMGY